MTDLKFALDLFSGSAISNIINFTYIQYRSLLQSCCALGNLDLDILTLLHQKKNQLVTHFAVAGNMCTVTVTVCQPATPEGYSLTLLFPRERSPLVLRLCVLIFSGLLLTHHIAHCSSLNFERLRESFSFCTSLCGYRLERILRIQMCRQQTFLSLLYTLFDCSFPALN